MFYIESNKNFMKYKWRIGLLGVTFKAVNVSYKNVKIK